MSLRRRLALTLALTALPVTALALWARAEIHRRGAEQTLRERVTAHVEALDRERCESQSARRLPFRIRPFGPRGMFDGRGGPSGILGGPGGMPGGPGVEGAPGDGFGPPPEPGGRRARPRRGRDGLARGPLVLFAYDDSFHSKSHEAPEFPASLRDELEQGAASAALRDPARPEVLLVGVRTGWEGGACAFVLATALIPPAGAFVGVPAGAVAAVAAIFLGAVWVAAGPAVRRIRHLTEQVRRTAVDHYQTPVDVSGSDEIGQLARAFNDAASEVRSHIGRLERREQTLREFVANTTHDVMLPLTVLQGHLVALRDAAAKGSAADPAIAKEAVEEAHYLGSLMHNLSAAAKLETGEPALERHPVDLSALVERVVARHKPIAEQRAVELNVAVPGERVTLLGDVTLLEQAVSNVVHNSVRYNAKGGHAAVVLEAHAGAFSLRVTDDGPGVPDEQLGKLFERRFRGDAARSRRPEGQGLGLSIARDVCDRHGIAIAARRSEYGGLEVELSGPLAVPPSSETQ